MTDFTLTEKRLGFREQIQKGADSLIQTRFLSYAPEFSQWEATGPNHDLGSPVGSGSTREEAIADLIDQTTVDSALVFQQFSEGT